MDIDAAAMVKEALRHPAADEALPASLEEAVAVHLRRYFLAHGEQPPPPGVYDRILPLLERPLINEALRATGGNQLRAAALLGLNRNTLRKKMLALGIRAGES